MPRTCLLPGCHAAARTRGLCHTHYIAAGRAVTRGETTWARLEAAGYCLPSSRLQPSRPTLRPTTDPRAGSSNPYTRWAGTQIIAP